MVKIYGLDSSLIHDAKPNEGFVIDVVRASDYVELENRIAELEKQRDALIAENAALKVANKKLISEQQAAWPIGLLDSFIAEHEPETPSTDAAIAEIGALAVDGFAKFYAEESQYLEPELMECAKVYANKLRGGGV